MKMRNFRSNICARLFFQLERGNKFPHLYDLSLEFISQLLVCLSPLVSSNDRWLLRERLQRIPSKLVSDWILRHDESICSNCCIFLRWTQFSGYRTRKTIRTHKRKEQQQVGRTGTSINSRSEFAINHREIYFGLQFAFWDSGLEVVLIHLSSSGVLRVK